MKPNAVGELGGILRPFIRVKKTKQNCDSFMIERAADRAKAVTIKTCDVFLGGVDRKFLLAFRSSEGLITSMISQEKSMSRLYFEKMGFFFNSLGGLKFSSDCRF